MHDISHLATAPAINQIIPPTLNVLHFLLWGFIALLLDVLRDIAKEYIRKFLKID